MTSLPATTSLLELVSLNPNDVDQLLHCGVRNGFDCPPSLWRSFVTSYERYSCQLVDDQNMVRGFLICNGTLIIALVVDEAFRRRGYARMMLLHLLAQTHKPLYLQVRMGNTHAQTLYCSLGFKKTHVLVGFYDSPKEDAYVMQLDQRPSVPRQPQPKQE